MAGLSRLVRLLCFGLGGVALTAAENTTEALPPDVEFIGRAPKLRIYPGGKMAENATWIMLTFGKIQEVTADLTAVRGRAIRSLAAEKDIIWTQETKMVGGAEAKVTRMELPLSFSQRFPEKCPTQGKPSRDDADDGSNLNNFGGNFNRHVAVEVYVFTEDATMYMGSERIDVMKGQMKFNIVSRGWPFCDRTNSLIFAMHLQLPTDGLTGTDGERSFADHERPKGGDRQTAGGEEGGKRKRFRARAGGGSDVAMDFPEIAVIDNVTENATINMAGGRERTTLLFQFPRFTRSMLYDPTIGFQPEGDLPPSEQCDICTDDVVSTDVPDVADPQAPVSFAYGGAGLAMVSLIAALFQN